MRYRALFFIAPLLLVGCSTSSASRSQGLAAEASPVQLRSIQARAFDTTDREETLRTVIATLQDLGFLIDTADMVLGTVSGTKLDGYRLRMMVSVRPRGRTQLSVRANAQTNLGAVEDPLTYQQFFTALAQSMFLTAHEIDGGPPAGVPVPSLATAPSGS